MWETSNPLSGKLGNLTGFWKIKPRILFFALADFFYTWVWVFFILVLLLRLSANPSDAQRVSCLVVNMVEKWHFFSSQLISDEFRPSRFPPLPLTPLFSPCSIMCSTGRPQCWSCCLSTARVTAGKKWNKVIVKFGSVKSKRMNMGTGERLLDTPFIIEWQNDLEMW